MISWEEIPPSPEAEIRIAAVGNGVDLSAYPLMQGAALDAMGIRAQVVPIDVPKAEFEECIHYLAASGFRGANILNPHKVDAARMSERFWVARYALGVANTLHFSNGIFAQNTEVPAIVQCLKEFPATTALVMGTGHAARSVVLALFDAGWKVKVWNRNANKTRILQTLFQRYGPVELASNPDPSGCKMIINATPLGAKAGEKPPIQWSYAQPKCVCVDLVFRRVPTEFLREAAMRGFKTVDGREIMVEQAALALEWWTGKEVPRGPMRDAVGLKPVLRMQ